MYKKKCTHFNSPLIPCSSPRSDPVGRISDVQHRWSTPSNIGCVDLSEIYVVHSDQWPPALHFSRRQKKHTKQTCSTINWVVVFFFHT
jgi:hypothetical protein